MTSNAKYLTEGWLNLTCFQQSTKAGPRKNKPYQGVNESASVKVKQCSVSVQYYEGGRHKTQEDGALDVNDCANEDKHRKY